MTNDKEIIQQILGKHLQNDAIDMLKINVEDLSAEIIDAMRPVNQEIHPADLMMEYFIATGVPKEAMDLDNIHHFREYCDKRLQALPRPVNQEMLEALKSICGRGGYMPSTDYRAEVGIIQRIAKQAILSAATGRGE